MNRSTLRAALSAAVLLTLGLCGAPALAQQALNIAMPDGPRQALLVDGGGSGPRPLVLLLHGHLGTAANVLGQGSHPSPLAQWVQIAAREHLLVAALQGNVGSDKHTGWHDCRLDAVEDPQTDDIGFAQAVVNQLVQAGRADPHRIYVMGMSNGAMMSYRLALELQPAPAAIAAVSGLMAADSGCPEQPRPVSVLIIQGTADPIVPYAGGKVGLRGYKTGTVIGLDASRDYWLRVDGLVNVQGLAYTFPHQPDSGSLSATRVTYGPPQGPQVETIVVQNGGHIEPSLRYHYGWLYHQLVGEQDADFESAEEAWAFFRDKRGH